MAITEKNISILVNDVNFYFKELYVSNIEAVKVCKIGNKYALEPVIEGKQIDSFYKTMNKRDLYNALQVLKTVLFNNASSIVNIYGDGREGEKKANTVFIKHLLQTFNEFGA